MLRPTSDTLKTGDTAPEFELPTADKKVVQLSDFRGRALGLIFIRGTW
jgi:peroxiredoxin